MFIKSYVVCFFLLNIFFNPVINAQSTPNNVVLLKKQSNHVSIYKSLGFIAAQEVEEKRTITLNKVNTEAVAEKTIDELLFIRKQIASKRENELSNLNPSDVEQYNIALKEIDNHLKKINHE